MRLPLVPGIKVQVSMPPSSAHPVHTHLHGLDPYQATPSPPQLAEAGQDVAGHQQRHDMHDDHRQQRQGDSSSHTLLLKYSGQLCVLHQQAHKATCLSDAPATAAVAAVGLTDCDTTLLSC